MPLNTASLSPLVLAFFFFVAPSSIAAHSLSCTHYYDPSLPGCLTPPLYSRISLFDVDCWPGQEIPNENSTVCFDDYEPSIFQHANLNYPTVGTLEAMSFSASGPRIGGYFLAGESQVVLDVANSTDYMLWNGNTMTLSGSNSSIQVSGGSSFNAMDRYVSPVGGQATGGCGMSCTNGNCKFESWDTSIIHIGTPEANSANTLDGFEFVFHDSSQVRVENSWSLIQTKLLLEDDTTMSVATAAIPPAGWTPSPPTNWAVSVSRGDSDSYSEIHLYDNGEIVFSENVGVWNVPIYLHDNSRVEWASGEEIRSWVVVESDGSGFLECGSSCELGDGGKLEMVGNGGSSLGRVFSSSTVTPVSQRATLVYRGMSGSFSVPGIVGGVEVYDGTYAFDSLLQPARDFTFGTDSVIVLDAEIAVATNEGGEEKISNEEESFTAMTVNKLTGMDGSRVVINVELSANVTSDEFRRVVLGTWNFGRNIGAITFELGSLTGGTVDCGTPSVVQRESQVVLEFCTPECVLDIDCSSPGECEVREGAQCIEDVCVYDSDLGVGCVGVVAVLKRNVLPLSLSLLGVVAVGGFLVSSNRRSEKSEDEKKSAEQELARMRMQNERLTEMLHEKSMSNQSQDYDDTSVGASLGSANGGSKHSFDTSDNVSVRTESTVIAGASELKPLRHASNNRRRGRARTRSDPVSEDSGDSEFTLTPVSVMAGKRGGKSDDLESVRTTTSSVAPNFS